MEHTTIVIDLPDSATATEATETLKSHGPEYYVVQVLPVAGGNRAYLSRCGPGGEDEDG